MGGGSSVSRYAGYAFALLFLSACSRPASESIGDGDAVDYNWDVRPILSNSCFSCHGPDEDAGKAGLRLDVRESAVAELPEYPGHFAIRPGDAAGSELLLRIASDDPDVVMPPPSTHISLTAAEIETLGNWIEQGAEYKPHWSFISPAAVVPQPSSYGHQAVNAIDDFVFAAIERNGLTPAGEADRETLISRATFTLTGLPPTPEEIDAFVSDSREDAYERLVDRLLASPAYGERMATEWLDAARFADSDGYLDDEYRRLLHPWRDWVIDAFNANMPYKQFGTVQIAGDLLANPSKDDLIASGFGRLHRRTAENGIIDEEYRVEYVIDRTDTVGTAFLGLSVGCARCHDHKFDPISHVDYYSLTAFFNSTDDAGFYPQEKWETGPTMYLTDAATDRQIAALRAEVAASTARYETALAEAQARIDEDDLAGRLTDAATLAAIDQAIAAAEVAHYSFDTIAEDPAAAELYAAKSGIEPSQPLRFSAANQGGLRPAVLQAPDIRPGIRGNAMYLTANNKGFLDKADGIGYYDHYESFSLDFWLYTAKIYDEAAVLNHDDHLRFGSGGWSIDLTNNRVALRFVHAYPRDQIVVTTREALPANTWSHVTMTYDGSARADGIALFFNGVAVELEVERDGLTKSMLPLGMEFAGLDDFHGIAFGKRWQRSPLDGGAIDELRVFDAELSPLAVAVLHEGADALRRPDAPVDLAKHLALLDADVSRARADASTVRAGLNELLTSLPEVMIMGDTPEVRPTFVLERGVYSNHGEEVSPRGLIQIFPYGENLPQNRAGLAQWIFDPEHPLTARVYVNRLWQMHFGTGLVRTAEELGSQGEIPTHPELLDWLARRFVESDWDIKALNRLIVMSAAFRRDTAQTPDVTERDPENRWLARGVTRRLTAEMIRDNALAASGLLDTAIGGPSVLPYQPDGVWEAIGFYARDKAYPDPESVPKDHHRRSLYSMVRRGAPVPSMTIFDFPRRHMSRVTRPTSNTPLQSLVLLNDPQYVEASRALATRAMHAADELDVQLERMFRLAARRAPSMTELDTLRAFFEVQHAEFLASNEAVAAYLDIGVLAPDPTLDAAWLAALGSTANVIFNLPDSYTLR
jgi:hypothetical protein